MPDPIDEHSIHAYLMAFADGELDAEQNAAVLSYLAGHPEAFAAMEQEQRLRAAARRVVGEHGSPPPELRATIYQLAEDAADAAAAAPPAPPASGHRPAALRASSLAMVSLLAGALIGYYALRPTRGPADAGARHAAIVPVALVQGTNRIHVDCSRFAASVHNQEFPRTMGALAVSVQHDLGRDRPYPELSKAGYEMVGVGPCKRPLLDTVHLLYHSTRDDVKDTVSIFVQPNTGQLPIEPGVAYLVGGPPSSPHPTFVWRTEQVVYFLVGDDAETVQRILALLEVPAKTN